MLDTSFLFPQMRIWWISSCCVHKYVPMAQLMVKGIDSKNFTLFQVDFKQTVSVWTRKYSSSYLRVAKAVSSGTVEFKSREVIQMRCSIDTAAATSHLVCTVLAVQISSTFYVHHSRKGSSIGTERKVNFCW